jgi:uncharacterized protein (DUF58 family)
LVFAKLAFVVLDKLNQFNMKTLTLAFCAFFVMYGADAQPVADFQKTLINYGTVAQGSDGTRTFKVTNTGNQPLIIKNATASCNCTVPEWPKEPILPGKSADVKVRYNTERLGPINKQVTIEWNGGEPIVLRITGEVVDIPPSKEVVD